jgi:hypothetical protein
MRTHRDAGPCDAWTGPGDRVAGVRGTAEPCSLYVHRTGLSPKAARNSSFAGSPHTRSVGCATTKVRATLSEAVAATRARQASCTAASGTPAAATACCTAARSSGERGTAASTSVGCERHRLAPWPQRRPCSGRGCCPDCVRRGPEAGHTAPVAAGEARLRQAPAAVQLRRCCAQWGPGGEARISAGRAAGRVRRVEGGLAGALSQVAEAAVWSRGAVWAARRMHMCNEGCCSRVGDTDAAVRGSFGPLFATPLPVTPQPHNHCRSHVKPQITARASGNACLCHRARGARCPCGCELRRGLLQGDLPRCCLMRLVTGPEVDSSRCLGS